MATRFSSLSQLANTVAQRLKWRTRKSGVSCAEEFQQTEEAVVRCQQRDLFSRQIARLSQGLPVEKQHWFSALDPFMKEGSWLLRVAGRISYSLVQYCQRRPIILVKS